MKKDELMEIMLKYAYIDWQKAKITDLTNTDKTPQFEQDASNCWIYSMCNNAYYNFNGDFRLADLIDVKNLMKSYGINIKNGASAPLSGAFIAMYLSKKRGVEVRSFQIDFFKDTLKFSEFLKKGYVFEMSRIHTPLLYTDAYDDGKVNQIYHTRDADGWHSTNICFDADKKLMKELGSWDKTSKENQFYYDVLQFGNNIKTRAISAIFNFLGVLKDE